MTKYNSYDEFKKKFYHSKEWKTVRMIKIQNDVAICKRCGKLSLQKGELHVDHKVEITEDNYQDYSIILSLDNLQVLCRRCHFAKTHIDKSGNKSNFAKNGEFDYKERDGAFYGLER